MRLVPINCVKEGSFLAKTIFDADGRILLRENVELSKNYINRIKEIGIYSIYINDKYSHGVIEDIIKPELRQKTTKILKNTFENLQFISDTTSRQPTNKQDDLANIYNMAEELLDEILFRDNLLINLVDIKIQDNYTYQHSVNVAVLSLILGIKLELNKTELLNLCTGALLHDMGKIFIDESILLKKGKLTDEEFQIIKNHPLKGYEYLKKSLDISPTARIIALQHHEKVDGSGYPEGLKYDKINKLARIVAIADVYDALTSDRPYRKAMSPNDAVEYIFAGAQTHFDYKFVKAFSEIIIPYPVGSLVKLSTDEIASVEDILPNFPLRPTVKVLKSTNIERVSTNINLMNELQTVITQIAYTLDD